MVNGSDRTYKTSNAFKSALSKRLLQFKNNYSKSNRTSNMLPFNELPSSLLKELGLYVKVNTPNILEYAFVDITQSNKDYNSHLIWRDNSNWYVAHDIHVFKSDTYNYKFDWYYFSADVIFSVEEAKTKLKQLYVRS